VSEPRYEGLVTRAIAFALDAAVINIVAIAVTGVVALGLSILSVPDAVNKVLLALGGVLFVAWSVGYFVTFWSTTGQTPGARLMRIMVCRAEDGLLVTPGVALLRVVYMTLAAIPLFAGYLTILVDDRRRGVHDMLAGTVVVEAVDVIVPEAVPSGPSAAPVDARPAPALTDAPRSRSASASGSM
jgi:uncharacterized RDD family membrane protein YckC